MSLSDDQWLFLRDVEKLIAFAESKLFKLILGEGYRTKDKKWNLIRRAKQAFMVIM